MEHGKYFLTLSRESIDELYVYHLPSNTLNTSYLMHKDTIFREVFGDSDFEYEQVDNPYPYMVREGIENLREVYPYIPL